MMSYQACRSHLKFSPCLYNSITARLSIAVSSKRKPSLSFKRLTHASHARSLRSRKGSKVISKPSQNPAIAYEPLKNRLAKRELPTLLYQASSYRPVCYSQLFLFMVYDRSDTQFHSQARDVPSRLPIHSTSVTYILSLRLDAEFIVIVHHRLLLYRNLLGLCRCLQFSNSKLLSSRRTAEVCTSRYGCLVFRPYLRGFLDAFQGKSFNKLLLHRFLADIELRHII